MAGIYIHIPYCRKLCYYCDFHFTVSLRYKPDLLGAINQEIISRRENWRNEKFSTIYFGGGTPSVLSIIEINRILENIYEHYSIENNLEISFEANPDDLNPNYLETLKKETPINRLSIGIQSFDDRDLRILNRRHTGRQAFQCVEDAKSIGFDNISIDLIYGIPGMSDLTWQNNLDKAVKLNCSHLSSYHLTVEPKTMFSKFLKRGSMKEVPEKNSLHQFNLLLKNTEEAGYEQYEISNFAKNEAYSKHNSSYWKGIPYAGFGPSAHSFQNGQRRWNLSNNAKYIQNLKESLIYYEQEELNKATMYNEYILTSIRTKWGINLNWIQENFGETWVNKCALQAERFVKSGHIIPTGNNYVLSDEGKFISDYIIKEIMVSS